MLVFSFLSVSEYPAAPQGVFPGEAKWRMKEGLGVIKEVVRFLRTIRPEQPPALSPGMCRAAADHCADQAAGRTGHRGNDRSGPGDRLSRYGTWSGLWGQNIAYGKRLRARSSLRSLLTMIARREHTAETFSIPVSIALATGRTRFMAAFARSILPVATPSGPPTRSSDEIFSRAANGYWSFALSEFNCSPFSHGRTSTYFQENRDYPAARGRFP